jgi:hypothetical protein
LRLLTSTPRRQTASPTSVNTVPWREPFFSHKKLTEHLATHRATTPFCSPNLTPGFSNDWKSNFKCKLHSPVW